MSKEQKLPDSKASASESSRAPSAEAKAKPAAKIDPKVPASAFPLSPLSNEARAQLEFAQLLPLWAALVKPTPSSVVHVVTGKLSFCF